MSKRDRSPINLKPTQSAVKPSASRGRSMNSGGLRADLMTVKVDLRRCLQSVSQTDELRAQTSLLIAELRQSNELLQTHCRKRSGDQRCLEAEEQEQKKKRLNTVVNQEQTRRALRRPGAELRGREEELPPREEEQTQREEELQLQRETKKIQRKEEELQQEEEELQQEKKKRQRREEELQHREEELQHREEELQRREEELQRREEELQQEEAELQREKKKLQRREEELQQKEAGLQWDKQKLQRREEELQRQEEELQRKEAGLQWEKEKLQRREEELQRQKEELQQKEEELQQEKKKRQRREEELQHREEELQRREEELQQEEAELQRDKQKLQRREEELQRQEEELQQKEEELSHRLSQRSSCRRCEEHKQTMLEMEAFYKDKLTESRSALKEKEEQLRSFKDRVAQNVVLSLKTENTENMNSPVNQSRLTEMYQQLRVCTWPNLHFTSSDQHARALVQDMFRAAAEHMKRATETVCGVKAPSPKVEKFRQTALENLQLALYHSSKQDVFKAAFPNFTEGPEELQLASECYWLGCLMELHSPPLRPRWDKANKASVFPRDIRAEPSIIIHHKRRTNKVTHL